MSKKKIGIIFTIISLAATIALSGCGKSSAPSNAKTENTNQAVVISNTNSVNTTVSASNNYGQNNSTQSINNAAAPPVNNAPSVNHDLPVNKKTPPPAAANEPTPQIGSGGNDMLLVIQARNALSVDQQLLNSVIVDSKEGNIVLTGKVASAADKAKAAQLVQGVKGVKSLKNNISVLK